MGASVSTTPLHADLPQGCRDLLDAEVLAQLDEVAIRGARMVKQLLAYARVKDAGELDDEHFDAVTEVLQAAARWRQPAQAQGKRLQVDNTVPEDQLFTVSGSATMLGEAVSNLIDNALRYGGNAWVSLHREGNEAVIRITDNGAGIPAAQIDGLFEPFARGEPSRNRATGGAGLGLTLARAIAEQHGGRLTLANRPEGGLRASIEWKAQG